jgi:hypothetical protein
MSISVQYQAVIPVDGATYQKHAAVLAACKYAGVSLPPETAAFFDDQGEEREVTNDGIRVAIGPYSKCKAGSGSVMGDGEAVIDLSKLPPGTAKIRIFVS